MSCKEAGCTTQATYNFEGQKKALYCSKHGRPKGMVDVKNLKCIEVGCKKQPHYNVRGEKKALYCGPHGILRGMVDVRHKHCEHEECIVRATYNVEGERVGRYCSTHGALLGMVDVTSRRCLHPGCKTQSSYNEPGKTKPLYCALHGQERNMVNVISRTCQTEGCSTLPTFNTVGSKIALFCSYHAKPGMVDVKSKQCNNKGCTKQPKYNYNGETTGIYCKKHGDLFGMIYITNFRCQKEEECTTEAIFNYCGLSPIFCSKHKVAKMVKHPRKRCEAERCKQVACFGANGKHLRCEDHALPDDMDFRVAPCKQCGRKDDYLDKEQLCRTYCSQVKLAQIEKRWQKLHEEVCLAYLDKHLTLPEFVSHLSDDCPLDVSCNTYRPDRVYDCGTHYTIFEVDENQHRDKGQGCVLGCEGSELKRMHEIQVAAGVHCIFLRFNPDAFRVNGKIVNVKFEDRIKVAITWLQKCFRMKPTKDVLESPAKYKHLFYDNYNSKNNDFLEINDVAIASLLYSS